MNQWQTERVLDEADRLAAEMCKRFVAAMGHSGSPAGGVNLLQIVRTYAQESDSYQDMRSFLRLPFPDRTHTTVLLWNVVRECLSPEISRYETEGRSCDEFRYLLGWTARLLRYHLRA